jgi:hypothetical protein
VALLLAGCSGSGTALDQTGVTRVLLTAEELPDRGWTFSDATRVAPTPVSATTLASGSCARALDLMEELSAGATAFARASYARDGSPALEVIAQSFPATPERFLQMREIVSACPRGELDDNGRDLAFTLTTVEYAASGASGARLSVADGGQPRALDLAVVVRGRTVIAGVATGVDGAANQTLLDRVMVAQVAKLDRG